MRFICGGFYLIFLSMISGFALGSPVQYETVRVGPASYAPSGVTSPVTVRFSGPAIQTNQIPSYKQIVPVATKPVIGRLGRSLIRGGGVGLAVTAAVEGLGYLIDQATGEITKEVIILGNPTGSRVFGSDQAVLSRNLNQVSELVSFCSGATYCSIHASTQNISAQARRWNCVNSAYPVGYSFNSPTSNPPAFQGYCYSSDSIIPESSDIVDLDSSDYEIIDDAIDDFSLSQKSRIVSQALQDNPISGVSDTADYPTMVISPIPEVQSLFDMWPQLQEALSQALNATLAQILQLTNPEFSPTPEEQELINRGIWAPPPETSVAVDLELPAFCQWAEFICRPFVDTEHPDLPELDLEAQDYDSGLPGSGQCPAPILIELNAWGDDSWGEYSISLQPVCDFASAIRPFLLAIAYLVSAFIVVGVRR